ncbi:MAG TPA: hypothetical protein VFE47_30170 [Tepidisphaeraceae bacterium]|nr:hypothetical protein [Tepidisphaeraceae bacterium]
MEEQPQLITGGLHADARGSVSFVNDFHFAGVERFYTIRFAAADMPRGWVGHRREKKWFTVIEGTVIVSVVKPDDWQSPSRGLEVSRYMLSSQAPAVLCVPGGYATCSTAKTDGAILMVFSSGKFESAQEDDFRYPIETWPA